jgi:RNA polymerase sigma factor (sigma-70 family)
LIGRQQQIQEKMQESCASSLYIGAIRRLAEERMATGPEKLLVKVQQLLRQGDLEGLNNGDLLREFVTRNDTAALERLIRNLSPMVWGLCRRLLRDEHDAEDVFQTAFLLLVRKARSIVNRQAVGSWVYRVAYHAAMKARVRSARRQARETRLTEMSRADLSPEIHLGEVNALLDQEVNQLSEKYRQVITLCCLQGMTNEQAAHELGCPAGTVAARLSRARDQLRGRLSRWGIALSTAELVNVLAPGAVAGPVPATLLRSTITAATALIHGMAAEAFSSSVHALGDEVVRHLVWRKLKWAAVCLAGVLGVAGAGWFVQQQASRSGPAAGLAVPGPTGSLAKEPPVVEAVRSGPSEGQSLRGKVLPALHLNGPGKGGQTCLLGKYGTKPVVLIFARKRTAPVQELIQRLDAACVAHADRSLRSFVVFDEATQGPLKDWLAATNLEQVVLTVGRPAVFREYAISEQADVTVVLYANFKVIVNHSFRKGQLTDADIDTILNDLPKILP